MPPRMAMAIGVFGGRPSRARVAAPRFRQPVGSPAHPRGRRKSGHLGNAHAADDDAGTKVHHFPAYALVWA